MTGLIEHLLATPAWVALLVVFALPALESSAFLGFINRICGDDDVRSCR